MFVKVTYQTGTERSHDMTIRKIWFKSQEAANQFLTNGSKRINVKVEHTRTNRR